MWKNPRLSLVLLFVVAVLTLTEAEDHDKEGTRWRWPDESPSRVGAGRLIPARRPAVQLQQGLQPIVPEHHTFSVLPAPVPVHSATRAPELLPTVATRPPVPVTDPIQVAKTSDDADIQTASNSAKNTSAVPLLKDAGKPGNPYILLNDIFPPQNSIRTKEEEEANLNSLANKDLGGLSPGEVYLADDDLFVVRGFNYKIPYTADHPGPPISDYEAPSPQPPPPPEPGTVFYPSNETENTFNFFNPNFNSTDAGDLPFFPFIPGGLNENGFPPGFPEDPNFIPFPFLPPPPPHWTEEKEFADNDIRDPFLSGGPGETFPFSQGGPGPGQGFALFNGTQGPPPPSGLNGFPGIPPQFQNGNPQAGAPPGGLQRPPGFPPGGPAGFSPGGPEGFPPGGPNVGLPPLGGPGGIPPTGPSGNITVLDDDEDVPFTPLFPERPVEYYYPTHNTTAQPPGPFGPGIFVPPPVHFFAPRNKSEVIKVVISPNLFKPPFNLPNYYKKESEYVSRPLSVRPLHLRPHGQPPVSHYDGYGNDQEIQKVPGYRPIASRPTINPVYPSHLTSNNNQAVPALQPNVQSVPNKATGLLNTQYKEISQLPKLPQLPQHQAYEPNYQHGLYHQPYRPFESPTYGVKVPSQTHLNNGGATKPSYNPPSPQYQPRPQYISTNGPTTVSLESDINVNYRPQRPAINPDSEIIDPTRFHLNPTWNPYTAAYAQPVQSQKYESLSQPTAAHQSTDSSSSLKKPSPNFVTVYRIGGGSYSYNLNQGR